MSIEQLLEKIPTLPSTGFLKVGSLLKEHEALSSLEKTAELATTLVEKEQEILALFYKEAARHASFPDGINLKEQTASLLIQGGCNLLKTASSAYTTEKQDALAKLATVGVINAKLQTAAADPTCPSEYKADLYKLGQENNQHCIALLKELVKESQDVIGMDATAGRKAVSGFFGSLGGKIGDMAGAVKNTLADSQGKGFAKTMHKAVDGGGTGIAPATSSAASHTK